MSSKSKSAKIAASSSATGPGSPNKATAPFGGPQNAALVAALTAEQANLDKAIKLYDEKYGPTQGEWVTSYEGPSMDPQIDLAGHAISVLLQLRRLGATSAWPALIACPPLGAEAGAEAATEAALRKELKEKEDSWCIGFRKGLFDLVRVKV